MPSPIDETQTPRTSKFAHLLDVLFFRTLGVGLIVHEVQPKDPADWKVVAAGICMFFMPDALRGQDSGVLKLIRAIRGQPAGEP